MARLILFLIVPALAVGLGAPMTHARTLTVDCEGTAEFTRIQAAVDAAVTGDILEIAPCTYEESITAGLKILTFRGTGPGVTVAWSDEKSPPRTVRRPFGRQSPRHDRLRVKILSSPTTTSSGNAPW